MLFFFGIVSMTVGGISCVVGDDSHDRTTTDIGTSTTSVAHSPVAFPAKASALRVSRQGIYKGLDELNVGFLPLNTHSDEWVSTMLPNGDVSVDIYGPTDQVEAVELWFRIEMEPLHPATGAIETILKALTPNEWIDGLNWFVASVGSLDKTGKDKVQATLGQWYLTVQYVPTLRQIFFSIDAELQ